MVLSVEKKRREYKRKWRKANREKVNEYARKKYQENIEKERVKAKIRAKNRRKVNPGKYRETARKFRKTNLEKYRETERKWRKLNPGKVKEANKRSYLKNKSKTLESAKKYYWKNKEKALDKMRKYRKANREELNEKERVRRRIKSKEIRKSRLENYQNAKKKVLSHYTNGKLKCRICNTKGIPFLAVDHVYGRKITGDGPRQGPPYQKIVNLGFPSTYQVLCHNCNIIKEFNRKQKLGYSKNKSAVSTRNIRKKRKSEVLVFYSKGKLCCKCCKFNNILALSIDHISGREKSNHSRNLSSDKLYQVLKKQEFPSGYQVLCQNCNLAKSNKGICPHKK